jgi:hypothetical protein
VNLVTGLERVREMLASNGATMATLDAVDAVLENAARTPGGGSAQAGSLLQMTKMLMRTPAANKDVRVYNDLAKLEEQLTQRAEMIAQERSAVVDRPMPKDKKFYKAQKEKAKAAKNK